ncbi:MAG TPA: TonB-dependent receptor [Terriglobales bacterium]|jgi:hypothetical protein|nr:TonB-dependent receptor [Terriglobales bacterium]
MLRIGLWVFLLAFSIGLFGQSNAGELRLKVNDPAGLGLKSTVELASEASQFHKSFTTDDAGALVVKNLPFGLYYLEIQHEGFAKLSDSLEIRSTIPAERHFTLSISTLNTSVTVNDSSTLIDPHQTGTINRIGSDLIQSRLTSLPGRSLQELVNSQPGWFYEGNAVLHPRGAEYQTQFVVDGIPLTDNRSPSFGSEIEAASVQSVSIYTAGIPAEYGRKMGGVVEVNTTRNSQAGLHGQLDLFGGSFRTASASGALQYGWGKNILETSASGGMTDHYLNPPVLQNYTNSGTTGDFAVHYGRDLTERDRISLTIRHELSRFLLPNELIQQSAGQRQDRDILETMGVVSYQHVFSPNVLGDFRGMIRDDSQGLRSNALSTPIIASQDNGFRDGYFKGTISVHHGRHEWKAGLESDAVFLRERFSYTITDPTRFDPDTPLQFDFAEKRPDLEQSAFVQDLVRLGNWTLSAGLRWDHYQLLLNQNAVSPRLGIARYFPSAGLVVHASYDRVFQTPDFENILLSSSSAVVSLSSQILRLPVAPSHGNYYEIGMNKGVLQKASLAVNYYDRNMDNYADDDTFLNTSVGFPTAFRRARIYGIESKLELPRWRHLSGFISHSYMVGSAYLPVTGGLFLGDEASNALNNLSGRVWVSSEERHTVRTRFMYQIVSRAWVGFGGAYGTGLPVEFNAANPAAAEAQAIAQYGQAIADRVNFATGRVKPSLSLDASLGLELWKKDKTTVRLQADAQNLNNRINLINFAGLFSGNTVAPPRIYMLRLDTSF